MPIALVSAGAVSASMSPSFGQPTTAGNLLLAFIACNSSGATDPITTTSPGWTVITPEFGQAFVWAAIAYKPNCGTAESPPTFQPSGVSTAFTMLAEYSGAVTSSPLDQVGNGGSSGGSTQTATCSAPDSQAGDLVAYAAYWNGGNSGSTITTSMHDGAGNALTPAAHDNSGTGTGSYFEFMFALAQAAGGSGDTGTAVLSTFESGSCGIASFKAKVGTARTATASLTVTPSFAASPQTAHVRGAALTVTPRFLALPSGGARPSGSVVPAAMLLGMI